MSVVYDKPVKNLSGEAIPPFSVVEVDSMSQSEGRRLFEVKKPADGGSGVVFIGPNVRLDVDKEGLGSKSFGVRVAYDAADTPAIGEIWGGQNDSWKIHKSGAIGAFTILGDEDGDTVRVDPLSSSSGSNERTILITTSVAAADWAWDAVAGEYKLTPEAFTAGLLSTRPDGALKYDPTFTIDAVSEFTTQVTVTTGMGRIGKLLNGKLFNVDCEEVDLSFLL